MNSDTNDIKQLILEHINFIDKEIASKIKYYDTVAQLLEAKSLALLALVKNNS